MIGELIYLACPYSDPDPAVMVARFDAVNRVGARLMAEGKYIFSPISHTHPLAVVGSLPRGWDYWEGYDKCMISRCSKLIVLKLDGWVKSTGVNAEVKIAKEMGIPVEYLDPII